MGTDIKGPATVAVGHECLLNDGNAAEILDARKVAHVEADDAGDVGESVEKGVRPRGRHELLDRVFTDAAPLGTSC